IYINHDEQDKQVIRLGQLEVFTGKLCKAMLYSALYSQKYQKNLARAANPSFEQLVLIIIQRQA
ncbi:MAG TPA: hypothetical protein VFD14_03680, partial [Clostridia bacterium]|nr:hypothetical protein [Clostridia bacterium]